METLCDSIGRVYMFASSGSMRRKTRRANCDKERTLGAHAAHRVRELVRTRKLDFEYVACSCPAGTEGTQSCNYGRHCGILKANGRGVGEILIAENLAVPFVCGRTKCPRTPKPWCNNDDL